MKLDRVIAVRNSKAVYRDGDRCIKVFNAEYPRKRFPYILDWLQGNAIATLHTPIFCSGSVVIFPVQIFILTFSEKRAILKGSTLRSGYRS